MSEETGKSTEIIVAGWMDYPPEDRDKMLAHLVELGHTTREAESGCLDYAMTPATDDERRIRVFERWSSQEALDAHFATAHMLAFREASAGPTRLGVSLSVYGVASGRTMR